MMPQAAHALKHGPRRAGAPALALAGEAHDGPAVPSRAAWWRGAAGALTGAPPRVALAFLVGVACAAGVLSLAERGAPVPAADAGLAARLAAMEPRLAAAEAALAARGAEIERVAARAEAAVRMAELAAARPQNDGFVAALLNLQMAVGTSRPWHRELRAVLELDAGRTIAPPVLEVLSSHSLRGVPTEAELRERFLALAPAIAWRMPPDGDVLDRALGRVRAGLSEIGLAAAPAPGPGEAAVASIAERIRRGDLAGAVSDTTALDRRAEPLLAGWAAQARARLAVEQAVRETILSALARPARP